MEAKKSSKDIFGSEVKYISNCNLSKISTDGRLISINEKYLAISQNSPGVINIIDSNNLKHLETNNLISINDKSNILDIEFSPFDSNILAYSNENNSVIIAKIVEKGKKIELSNFDIFKKHTKKVNMINFNPVASNIMSSGSIFREVYIWDSTKLEKIYRELPNLTKNNNYTSLLWAPNGKSLGITTKKGFLNIFDIRENKYYIKNQIEGFSDSHKINFNWIDDNNIVVLGHNKNNKNERIMSLFDIRKQCENEMIKVYSSIIIDEGLADSIPFINHELKLIYSVGKDSSNIKICDYSKSALEILTKQIIVQESNVYSAIYPRKFLNKKIREIDRIVRSNKNNNIYYSAIKIPEKNSGFDGDLYPNEESGKPLYTEEIWKEIIEGKLKDENDIKIIKEKIQIENDKIKTKDYDEINNKNVYKTDETKLSIQTEINKENNKNLKIQNPKINENKEENNNKQQNNNNKLQAIKEDKLKKLLLLKNKNQQQNKTEENYNEINLRESHKNKLESLEKIFNETKEKEKQKKPIKEKIIKEENKPNDEKENLDLKQNFILDNQKNENDLRIKKMNDELKI